MAATVKKAQSDMNESRYQRYPPSQRPPFGEDDDPLRIGGPRRPYMPGGKPFPDLITLRVQNKTPEFAIELYIYII